MFIVVLFMHRYTFVSSTDAGNGAVTKLKVLFVNNTEGRTPQHVEL